jgi:hypothetical protein
MDIFRRAPDAQWSTISPGFSDWKLLESSSSPLNALRFGDFNGDGITDVLAVEGGHWSISRSGASPWQVLNPSLSDKLDSVLIGDIDGDGLDDIVRLRNGGSHWDVSLGGRTPWQQVLSMSAEAQYPIFGHWAGGRADQLLVLDDSRRGDVFNFASRTFSRQGDFPY